ncbi:MAG: rhodanese-like domain-containing protein [Candidatus Thiodiazotropha sp. (ex Lucinoma borealis)]|nr:rhodanese-like domain-containing protein [Candidatus Thiodiazotropha sp. (ex Lucinoma borealis)]
MYKILVVILLNLILTACTVMAQEEHQVVDAMEEYLDFVDYGGGAIFPEQIPEKDWENIFIVDARNGTQYEKEHIPGAVNIEWRQLLARRSELPRDKTILVYCNTGTLSAQAGFALRLAGFDNINILQGGIREWREKGGFKAYERAIQAPQH